MTFEPLGREREKEKQKEDRRRGPDRGRDWC